MRNILFLLVLVSFAAVNAETYRVSIKRDALKSEILKVEASQAPQELLQKLTPASSFLSSIETAKTVGCTNPNCKIIRLRSIPYYMADGEKASTEIYEEYLVQDENSYLESMVTRASAPGPQPEMRVLAQQGPKENRINLTILGDGYTEAEKAKFFADAERTTKNLFSGSTFASYLPLFNVYAVFVASQESGIGDGSPKQTAFKLYRNPKGSKRAIYPGDEMALERALQYAPATDYPIVLANDDFYGGLGGRYAISTSSVRSGMIVLRHELGHNFGEVGEEYDGGSVYTGANSSNDPQHDWGYWADAPLQFNEARILSGDYVWQNLSNKSYRASFNSTLGANGYIYGILSAVGFASAQDVVAKLDSKPFDLIGQFTNDRTFFRLGPLSNVSAGAHTIEFNENVHDGDNVLAFAFIYEMPTTYNFAPNTIGAYATYDDGGNKTYRPTHDSCIMREMTVDYFCSVDKENFWFKFLNRVHLIDGLTTANLAGNKIVTLATAPLKGLTVRWQKEVNSQWVDVPALNGLTEWNVSAVGAGHYKALVEFKTSEVRKYNSNFTAEKDIIAR